MCVELLIVDYNNYNYKQLNPTYRFLYSKVRVCNKSICLYILPNILSERVYSCNSSFSPPLLLGDVNNTAM